METGRASAVAHPIQGLVKYHGLRDFAKRVPYHASISVCTAPTHTRTTVTVLDGGVDEAHIDGASADPRALERVVDVVNAIRTFAKDDRPFRVVSENSFPSRVGLGSSASGFAALALAAAAAYGVELALSPAKLSAIARVGAGSASRAVTGWFSEWAPPAPGQPAEASVSRALPGARDVDMRIVVPLVRSDEPTEGVHREVLTSPLFRARLDYISKPLADMRIAVAAGDIPEIGRIAEMDTMNLHAITMTANPPRLTWRPETVAVMHRVRALRAEGIPCWYSIDTGATPYVNTTAKHEDAVAKALAEVQGIDELLRLGVGGPAHAVTDHLVG